MERAKNATGRALAFVRKLARTGIATLGGPVSVSKSKRPADFIHWFRRKVHR
jgi:hypothetical protein